MKKQYKIFLIIFILIPMQMTFNSFGLSILHNEVDDPQVPAEEIEKNTEEELKLSNNKDSETTVFSNEPPPLVPDNFENPVDIIEEQETIKQKLAEEPKNDIENSEEPVVSNTELKTEENDSETNQNINEHQELKKEPEIETPIKENENVLEPPEVKVENSSSSKLIIEDQQEMTETNQTNSNELDNESMDNSKMKSETIEIKAETTTETPPVINLLEKKTKPDIESFEEWKDIKLKEKAKIKAETQQQKSEIKKNNQVVNASDKKSESQSNVPRETVNTDDDDDGETVVRRKKNYASPDCGAKLVGHNPESSNPYHILSENKDDYMLNSCSNRVWFSVELCEPIKINKFELANLELFSNVPKNFRVYASERYIQTSKDWPSKYLIGLFEANNVRTIQSFSVRDTVSEANDTKNSNSTEKALSPAATVYAKYVRFEMISHYGTQHYCPLSLLRIYGTTMSDDHEEEMSNTEEDYLVIQANKAQEDDKIKAPAETKVIENKDPVQHFQKTTTVLSELSVLFYNNLISSVAKKLDEFHSNRPFTDPLFSRPNKSTRLFESDTPNELMTHEENIVQLDFYRILCSCNKFAMNAFLDCCQCMVKYKQKSLAFQRSHTFNWLNDRCGYFFLMTTKDNELLESYMKNMEFSLTNDIPENLQHKNEETYFKISMNKINYFINNNWFNEHIKKSKISPQFLDTIEEPEARNLDESKMSDANISEAENNDITLNTTLDTKEIESDSNTNHIDSKNSDSKSSEKSDSDVVINNVNSDTNEDGKEINANRSQQNNEDPTVTRTEPIIDQAKEQSQVIEEITTTIPNTPPTPIIETSSPTVNVPKESVLIYGKEGVFMRLSNRIKILELNMSLSSQYLEKLSQHYRMQMDEMERTFNFTTAALKEATRISDERDHKQYERIIILEKRLEALQKTVNLYNTLFENLKFQSDIQMLAVVAIITMVLLIKLITHFFSKKRRRVRSNSENIKSSQLSSKQVETIVEKRIALFIATIKEKDRKDSASTQDPVNTNSSNIKSIDKESVETLLPKLTYEWFTGEDTF